MEPEHSGTVLRSPGDCQALLSIHRDFWDLLQGEFINVYLHNWGKKVKKEKKNPEILGLCSSWVLVLACLPVLHCGLEPLSLLHFFLGGGEAGHHPALSSLGPFEMTPRGDWVQQKEQFKRGPMVFWPLILGCGN